LSSFFSNNIILVHTSLCDFRHYFHWTVFTRRNIESRN